MNPFDSPDTARRPEAVVGLFRDTAQAERAIRDLKAAGFSDSRIGVVMQDRDEERRLATGSSPDLS